MWRVNIGFARWFNNRYGTKGHVFDRRYGARLIAGDEHLQEVVRYIALNPVEAGCCDLPEQWPWSSYAGVLGLAPRPPIVDVEELLSHFGDAEDARARLRAFVEDGLARRVA
jgi:hypothetical protein